MAALALGAYALYMALAFGLRTVVQLRRTGSSGFEGVSGQPGSAEWLAGVLFVVAIAMGESWRIGVDETATTELVVDGPFALVRNPIFAAMLPASTGLALMVPSWVAGAGLAALVLALELQVRVVEEPYLLRAHGERYASYAARVGRFLPGIGRLRAP